MHIVPPYHSNIELENGNDNHQSPKTWSRENSPWFVVKTRAKRGGGWMTIESSKSDGRERNLMDTDVIIGCGWMIPKL